MEKNKTPPSTQRRRHYRHLRWLRVASTRIRGRRKCWRRRPSHDSRRVARRPLCGGGYFPSERFKEVAAHVRLSSHFSGANGLTHLACVVDRPLPKSNSTGWQAAMLANEISRNQPACPPVDLPASLPRPSFRSTFRLAVSEQADSHDRKARFAGVTRAMGAQVGRPWIGLRCHFICSHAGL